MNLSTTLYNPTAAVVEVREGKVRFCAPAVVHRGPGTRIWIELSWMLIQEAGCVLAYGPYRVFVGLWFGWNGRHDD
jgi:hypothetical protein